MDLPTEFHSFFSRLAEYIEQSLALHGVPGASAAFIVGETDMHWTGAFGLADVVTRRPAIPSTVYGIGSITKTFLATLTLILREHGKLNLDDPLSRIAPELGVRSSFADAPAITFRQVLSHTAGLPRESEARWESGVFPTAKEVVSSLSQVALVYPPLTAWKYSNLGYALLTLALSRLLGISQEELLGESASDDALYPALLRPLGLASSLFSPSRDELATGYVLSTRQEPQPALHPTYHAFAPAFGMYASAEELARFLAFQFHQGPVTSSAPLGETALRELHSPVFLNQAWSAGVALGGWRMSQLLDEQGQGYTMLQHGGAVHGFLSSMAFLPAYRVGIVILTNGFPQDSNWRPSEITKWALEAVLPILVQRASRQQQQVVGDLSIYAGRYEVPNVLAFRVEAQGDKLVVLAPHQERGGTPQFELHPCFTEQAHTFTIEGGPLAGEQAVFVFEEDEVVHVRAGSFTLYRA